MRKIQDLPFANDKLTRVIMTQWMGKRGGRGGNAGFNFSMVNRWTNGQIKRQMGKASWSIACLQMIR